MFAAALVIYGIGETMFGNWGTTLLVGKGVSATSANDGLAVFWAAVTLGRLAIALASTRVRSTHIYVVTALGHRRGPAGVSHRPAARRPESGCSLSGGLACSGFFPMTDRLRGGHLPSIVELAAGWLIAAYQVGYGLAAFGGGALQHVVSLSAVFRIAAAAAGAIGLLALAVARPQRTPPPGPPRSQRHLPDLTVGPEEKRWGHAAQVSRQWWVRSWRSTVVLVGCGANRSTPASRRPTWLRRSTSQCLRRSPGCRSPTRATTTSLAALQGQIVVSLSFPHPRQSLPTDNRSCWTWIRRSPKAGWRVRMHFVELKVDRRDTPPVVRLPKIDRAPANSSLLTGAPRHHSVDLAISSGSRTRRCRKARCRVRTGSRADG